MIRKILIVFILLLNVTKIKAATITGTFSCFYSGDNKDNCQQYVPEGYSQLMNCQIAADAYSNICYKVVVTSPTTVDFYVHVHSWLDENSTSYISTSAYGLLYINDSNCKVPVITLNKNWFINEGKQAYSTSSRNCQGQMYFVNPAYYLNGGSKTTTGYIVNYSVDFDYCWSIEHAADDYTLDLVIKPKNLGDYLSDNITKEIIIPNNNVTITVEDDYDTVTNHLQIFDGDKLYQEYYVESGESIVIEDGKDLDITVVSQQVPYHQTTIELKDSNYYVYNHHLKRRISIDRNQGILSYCYNGNNYQIDLSIANYFDVYQGYEVEMNLNNKTYTSLELINDELIEVEDETICFEINDEIFLNSSNDYCDEIVINNKGSQELIIEKVTFDLNDNWTICDETASLPKNSQNINLSYEIVENRIIIKGNVPFFDYCYSDNIGDVILTLTFN